MQFNLIRTYHSAGTNGSLFCNDVHICDTIELPWNDNAPRISCIPEGAYNLVKRYSKKFRSHLHLTDVKGRELILIHPANNALKELKGCIAPVMQLTGPGTGVRSREAMKKLLSVIDAHHASGKTISLTISAGPGHCLYQQHANDYKQSESTHTKVL